MTPILRTIRLQWDRAFDGAEIIQAMGNISAAKQLQWDRAFDGAEIYFHAIRATASRIRLQWDRAFDGAEIGFCRVGGACDLTCFNGTAPLMARKWAR